MSRRLFDWDLIKRDIQSILYTSSKGDPLRARVETKK